MPKITIATCRTYPVLSASNVAIADALRIEGFEVDVLGWNEATHSDFLKSDILLLRQTWDYQDDPGGFAAWVSRLSSLGCNIQNPAELAVWNNDKRTLGEFADAGVKVPRSCGIDPSTPERCFELLGTDNIVVKPAFGGSGIGVHFCGPGSLSEMLTEARSEALGRPFIAQEFLSEITRGEWKMTCIDGSVVFAICSVPRSGEFRVNSRFSPKVTVAQPPVVAVRAAEAIMSWIGLPMLACRIDGVMRDNAFICTEVELTDPDLHMDLFDEGPELFARAIHSYL